MQKRDLKRQASKSLPNDVDASLENAKTEDHGFQFLEGRDLGHRSAFAANIASTKSHSNNVRY